MSSCPGSRSVCPSLNHFHHRSSRHHFHGTRFNLTDRRSQTCRLYQAGVTTVVIGSFVHSITSETLEFIEDGMLVFDPAGRIIGLEKQRKSDEDWSRKSGVLKSLVERQWAVNGDERLVRFVRLRTGEFLIPGFVDTHTHAVQYPNVGIGQQYELLGWLKNVTFAEEQKYACEAYARRMFSKVVRRLLNVGTTTCSYFSSIHLSAAKVLASVCHEAGQRALVGKCNMDRNDAFEAYKEDSVEHSIRDTIQLIDYVRQHCTTESEQPYSSLTPPSSIGSASKLSVEEENRRTDEPEGHQLALVQPILTPRFAISCTDELLNSLGQLLEADPSLRLQTHLCESKFEIAHTLALFPGYKSYTSIYDRFNLLTSRTILAHCVHLEEAELALVTQRGCGLSHCPSSNFNLKSGICPVKSLLEQGVQKIGLGTDVSGGYGIGILSSIRDATVAGKAISFRTETDTSSLSIANLVYMATLGGARVCGLEDRIGNFVVGKEFDGLLIQTGACKATDEMTMIEDLVEDWIPFSSNIYEEGMNPNFFIDEFDPKLNLERLLEKFLFAGDDRNIGSVFVKGRVVGGVRPI
ncbi:hypothetical protein CROQUDRAFT_47962 [Cronartium quercuum f. sp. fusiforme G11]|uniref:Amidohydrolase-related domain-containing protein n=1 Tax=Cronartium quercuum f. sp. fusiforme G11 TaxID=708437 RepID=A0A9P6NC71_9BASI|nr:hypothetical protein CROQUDRAFT_47962 [Cronartium quercuum f. sp. fusiforme G11]